MANEFPSKADERRAMTRNDHRFFRCNALPDWMPAALAVAVLSIAAPLEPLSAQTFGGRQNQQDAQPQEGEEGEGLLNFSDLGEIDDDVDLANWEINGQQPEDGEPEELVPIAFKEVQIRDLVTQIADLAGKPIYPHQNIMSSKVTIINERLVPRSQALNFIALGLMKSNAALIDNGTHYSILTLQDLKDAEAVVLGPGENIMSRNDTGMVLEKVFQISRGTAKNLADVLREALPQWAKISVDEASNQIVVLYNIGTLQRIQRLVDYLDIEGKAALVLETFHLRYSDAEQIAQLIVDLYSAEEEENQGGRGGNRDRGIFQQVRPGETDGSVAVTDQLRVAFNKQHNSVTVMAEQKILDQIRDIITNTWDVPVDTRSTTQVYDLTNSDAVKLRDLLRSMFTEPESGGGVVVQDFFGGQQRQASRGGSEDQVPALHPLAGQVAFEADADKNRLIVTARSPEYFETIDQLVASLDKPSEIMLPILIELKYADSERTAEILNAIFAESGTSSGGIEGTEDTLTDRQTDSPFSEGGDTGATGDTSSQESERLSFWWEQSRPAEDERPISPLIAKARIVPVARQNALLILTPPEYRASILTTIEELDQPGRQVLIKATIAEVSRSQLTDIGVRWGSSDSIIDDSNPDNELRILGGIEATENNLLGSLFDTSVLSMNMDINAVLDFLQENTNIDIKSQPKIATSDNEEAVFFDGQDIPFITNTQTTDTGQLTNSFDYRQVGLVLAVRPHITTEGNVDMLINLELSSIVPGQTLFGGFIVDRRETTTKLTVRDGQTIVLSGILRQEESRIRRKAPLLGDLPIIGNLFRSSTTNIENTELLAFITPVILDNLGQDASDHEILEYQQEKFGDQPEELTLPTEERRQRRFEEMQENP